MNQIFTFAGVSRKHSELRLRTSNRPEYVDILIKEGHTDVDIISLPSPMGKDALVLHLLNSDFIIDNDEARDALVLEATKRKLPGYAKARKSEEVLPEEPAVEAEVQPAAEEDNVIILEQEVKPKKARKSSKAADAVTAWAEAVAEEQAA